MKEEITKEFPKGKESYCPICYFEDDMVIGRKECKHYILKLKEALIWCSGSDDFQDYGKAREGWMKICYPLLQEE